MSVQMTISDQKIVCRTCLKLLENTGYTYLDDENGYITNVGNIREMLQFCIPELDLHVSADPIICYQCLPTLVQVYNFKIKCVNGESMIRSYLTRNKLQEDSRVNLNCVVMEELIQNQKAQLENRIKHFMVQESPSNNVSKDDFVETVLLNDKPSIENTILDNDQSNENISDMIFNSNVKEEIGYSVHDQIKIESDMSVLSDSGTIIKKETLEEPQAEINNSINKPEGRHRNIVVRKDLFDTSKSKKKKTNKINNTVVTKNGRIIIKIDRRRLQSFNDSSLDKESDNPSSDSSSQETDINKTSLESNEQTSSDAEFSQNNVDESIGVLEKDESSDKYCCKKCGFNTDDMIKITSKVELLGKHMSMVHPSDMANQRSYSITHNFACTLCPFSVKNVELLRSHHLSAHKNKNLNNDSANGPIILNAAFRDKSTLPTNEPKILRRAEYVCDVCNYSTKDKSNLRKHLFTHGTKPLKCDFCSYKCVSPYQLRRHIKQKHASICNLKTRSAPYPLPNYGDADQYKITLDTLRSELDGESLL
ncbi:hypothetical protein GWI33_021718 [Rhynchophorus ferrugineus]|uniref:C2H2-type domain-containing protein n=1 Tax=Rhynchophorus ferrugineus TaxID=354439 RepID=A0A834IQZ5_RHYFE|nr:hypothetical protein GWI33_021718 [Rhynchophorus ferrugineus]